MFCKRLKKESKFFALFLLFFLSTPAWAENSPHTVGVRFGQVWPAGILGEGVNANTSPGLFYEYAASESFSLHSNITRSTHNELLYLTSATLGIRGNLFFVDQLVPYVSAGVGLYNAKKKDNTTHFGMNLSFGTDLDLNNTSLIGLSMEFHNIFASNASVDSGEVSGSWISFLVRGGLRF